MLQEDQINHELCKICLATVCFSDTLLKNLERIQFRALRKITGQTLKNPCEALLLEALTWLFEMIQTTQNLWLDVTKEKTRDLLGKIKRRNIISYHHKRCNFIDIG